MGSGTSTRGKSILVGAAGSGQGARFTGGTATGGKLTLGASGAGRGSNGGSADDTSRVGVSTRISPLSLGTTCSARKLFSGFAARGRALYAPQSISATEAQP